MVVYPIPVKKVEEGSALHLNVVADTVEREERSWFLKLSNRATVEVWKRDSGWGGGRDLWEQAVVDTTNMFDDTLGELNGAEE
jgi:hypothetical protein